MCHNLKLSPRYYGPFQVVAKIGTAAYYPVFQCLLFKEKLGDQITPLPTLPPPDGEGSIQPEPEAILEKRMKNVGNHMATEVLIKCLGAPLEDGSWEFLWKLCSL